MKRSFVFDATPLIHLAKAGLAPLISQLPGEKLTVPAVVREVVGEGRREYPDAAVIAALIDQGVIEVRAPPPRAVKALVRIHSDIHSGEAEALALAKETGGVSVVDDRAARAAARLQGIRVEGTYGVVLRALKGGSISAVGAEDALGRLVSSGWRCDAELYAALLRSLRDIGRRTRPP